MRPLANCARRIFVSEEFHFVFDGHPLVTMFSIPAIPELRTFLVREVISGIGRLGFSAVGRRSHVVMRLR